MVHAGTILGDGNLLDGQPEEVEFLPMFWSKGSVAENTLSYLKEEILNGRCKKVLGFNEPDGINQEI